jgi:hypothetical protein
MIYLADNLHHTQVCIKDPLGRDHWVVAKPLTDPSLMARLRAAWWVVKGDAEAVRFVTHPMDLHYVHDDQTVQKQTTQKTTT